MRGLSRRLTILMAFMLVLTACGSDDTGSTDETTTTAAASATTTTTAAGTDDTMADDPPAFAGTIKFGAAVSDTGTYAREGQDTRHGYDLWLDWRPTARFLAPSANFLLSASPSSASFRAISSSRFFLARSFSSRSFVRRSRSSFCFLHTHTPPQ